MAEVFASACENLSRFNSPFSLAYDEFRDLMQKRRMHHPLMNALFIMVSIWKPIGWHRLWEETLSRMRVILSCNDIGVRLDCPSRTSACVGFTTTDRPTADRRLASIFAEREKGIGLVGLRGNRTACHATLRPPTLI